MPTAKSKKFSPVNFRIPSIASREQKQIESKPVTERPLCTSYEESLIRRISPEEAGILLAQRNMVENRRRQDASYREICALIAAEQFVPSCLFQIVFDWNGVLIDGQNRLEAISKSGKTVDIRVVVSADPRIAACLDTQVRRTVSQRAVIAGVFTFDEKELSDSVFAAARKYFFCPTSKHPTELEVTKFVRKNKATLIKALGVSALVPGANAPVAAAFTHLLLSKSPKAETLLADVQQEKPTSPSMRKLRAQLRPNKDKKTLSPQAKYKLALACLAEAEAE